MRMIDRKGKRPLGLEEASCCSHAIVVRSIASPHSGIILVCQRRRGEEKFRSIFRFSVSCSAIESTSTLTSDPPITD